MKKMLLSISALLLVLCGCQNANAKAQNAKDEAFNVAGTSITLTALAIAAIAGIFLNAILPGNDYEFGKNPDGDASRGVYMMNTDDDDDEV